MNDQLNERVADTERPTVNYARITRAKVDRQGNLRLFRGWRQVVFHPMTEWDGFRLADGPFDRRWVVEVTLLGPRLANAKELHVPPDRLSQAPLGAGEGGTPEPDRG